MQVAREKKQLLMQLHFVNQRLVVDAAFRKEKLKTVNQRHQDTLLLST